MKSKAFLFIALGVSALVFSLSIGVWFIVGALPA